MMKRRFNHGYYTVCNCKYDNYSGNHWCAGICCVCGNKGVGVFSKIPTDILVFVLSIGITVAAFVAYMQYIQTSILWYMILAAIIAGFIVAFVAMYGWEKLSELWKRFGKDVK